MARAHYAGPSGWRQRALSIHLRDVLGRKSPNFTGQEQDAADAEPYLSEGGDRYFSGDLASDRP
jgi:hypothetical protein